MKSFDQTYADSDFQQQLDEARYGWMTKVPRSKQPDLHVEGLRGSMLARLLGTILGPRDSG